MDEQQRRTIRTAAYLAASERHDRRAALSTRTGKTRGKVDCNPPNKRCGNRCIPPSWDCRLEGKGTNSELAAHKTDPLAGIASIQRGAKDLARGVVRLNPSQVQRGRNSVIRGVVKLAPGDNLEQKKKLKRQLTQASTPVMAVIGIGLVGLGAHAGLKRGFGSYRNGLGADIDRAAARAVDSVLDRVPGVSNVRAARRAAGVAATSEIAQAVQRGGRIEAVRSATGGNTGKIGPLSFRPLSADTEASYLRDNLNELKARARSGSLSYDAWKQEAVQTLYGAQSPGTRARGQRGSIFSEHAANEFLVSKFQLNPTGAVGPRGGYSMAARNALIDTQLTEKLQGWGQSLRNDMTLRRYVGPNGAIRDTDVDRYIRELGSSTLGPQLAGLSAAQRNQAVSEAHRLMRSAINGTKLNREARAMRLGLVSEFDTYFENVAGSMKRNAAASDSPFGDGMTGLARYISRQQGQKTQILSRDHADLILRNHFHSRVMDLKNDFAIGDNTARRVAQQLTRSADLPDVDTAYRVLNGNGFTSLSRGGPTTGRKPAPKRRRTDAEGDLIRTATYLAARADLKEGSRLGKPCGESHIPKSHECRKGQQAPASKPKGNTRTVALAVTVAGLSTAAILAYRGRQTVVPGLSQRSIRALSSEQVKQGLNRIPTPFRDKARQLVGDAKLAAAHMALKVQGAEIKAVDLDNNFSTWVTPNGTHLSVGSVGDSLLTFGAERKGSVAKFPQYGLGFTVDTTFDSKGGMSPSQAKQLISTTKAMFKAQMEMLPDDAFLFAVPHKDDGLGGKRKSIYEKMGFAAIPGVRGDRLWALKNQGSFTKIPPEQYDYIRDLIRGDSFDPAKPGSLALHGRR